MNPLAVERNDPRQPKFHPITNFGFDKHLKFIHHKVKMKFSKQSIVKLVNASAVRGILNSKPVKPESPAVPTAKHQNVISLLNASPTRGLRNSNPGHAGRPGLRGGSAPKITATTSL